MPELAGKVGTCLLAAILLVAPSTVRSNDALPVKNGTVQSQHGCSVAFERYAVAADDGHEVLLAHGFMRSLKHMRGWAEFWQQRGIPVTLVTFCNPSWLNGHHQRNADDLITVRRHLGLDSIIYAGFSAGGLAAYLAAGEDPATLAYLGLDSVDSGDLAIDRPAALSVPALFLVAEPSMCNAGANFQAVFKKWSQYQVHTIASASHCHFEMPYDRKCAWLCGGADEAATTRIQADIRERATQWLLAR